MTTFSYICPGPVDITEPLLDFFSASPSILQFWGTHHFLGRSWVSIRRHIAQYRIFKPIFLNTIFVSSHMYPENPEGTQVIVGSKNMGYISDTARNWTHDLFRPKREPIPLGHSDGLVLIVFKIKIKLLLEEKQQVTTASYYQITTYTLLIDLESLLNYIEYSQHKSLL